jgi:hypothetical protein
VVLDDSYHLVTLDRQRQLVVSRTLEFVSRLQQGVFCMQSSDLADLTGADDSAFP